MSAPGVERSVILHGQEIAYRQAGDGGPDVVLIHGIGKSSATWDANVADLVAGGTQVLAVDLPGHGRSAKGWGDYSLGAMASTLRDLLDHLGRDPGLVVGHSLGGGVALQFAYQFPERCSALVLVASGGLGPEAFGPLRAATLPGAGVVISAVTQPRVMAPLVALSDGLTRLGWCPEVLSPDSIATLSELADPAARTAFLATLQGVVDISGQRVSAISKLPTAAHLPVLLVWGDRDRVIPVAHGRAAHDLLPDSKLVVFPGAGHEPHRFDPDRFADLVLQFARETAVTTPRGTGSAPRFGA